MSKNISKIVILFISLAVGQQMKAQQGNTLVYVLGDYSSSADASVKDIVTNIFALCNQLPSGDITDIKFFRVSAEDAPSPVCSVNLPAIPPGSGADQVILMTQRKKLLGVFAQNIYRGFSRYRDPKTTCIRKSLEMLGNDLRNTSGYQHVYLVVFSDMLEVCNYDGQKLNFEQNGAGAASKKLENYKPARPSFAGVAHLAIGIFVSSTFRSANNDWQQYWRLWFDKMGYRRKIEFASTVDPNWVAYNRK